MKSRNISIKIKKELFEKYKTCANYPNSNIIKNYNCKLWINNSGFFDESGYQIDHIDEFSITHNNNIENLQLLCHNCHAVKTKHFMKNNKGVFTYNQIKNGQCLMDIDMDININKDMDINISKEKRKRNNNLIDININKEIRKRKRNNNLMDIEK